MSLPSRLPIVISSLALVVSVSALLTTWRLTSQARSFDFAHEKFELIDIIQASLREHRRIVEALDLCPAVDPSNRQHQQALRKIGDWAVAQQNLLDTVTGIQVSGGTDERLKLIELRSRYNALGSAELMERGRSIVNEYCSKTPNTSLERTREG